MQGFGWPSTQHFIHTHVGSVGGFSWVYGIKRWEQWCRAYDFNTGEIRNYQDAEKDADQQFNPDGMMSNWKDMNSRIYSPNMVTDILFGCVLTDDLSCKFNFALIKSIVEPPNQQVNNDFFSRLQQCHWKNSCKDGGHSSLRQSLNKR